MPKVVVIGAGAIGLASAYELRRRGAEVSVIDMGQPGEGSSAGNAGWIVPVISTPLPSPGLVATSLKWMLKPDSPLYIKPRVNLAFSRWLWSFWRNCRPAPYQAGLEALGNLNRRTMPLFDEMLSSGVRFEMHHAGLLFVGLDQDKLEHAHADIRQLTGFSYSPPALLNAREVRDLEPGLSRDVAGGFLIDQERHIRPESLTTGLVDWLNEHRVEIHPECEVVGLERRNGAITGVITRAGTERADQVLLAAGAWTGPLAKRLGFRIPIEAGKGYSITWENPGFQLEHPLDLIDARAAITPFDGALRVAGTMEMSGLNTRLEPVRVEAIRRAGERYLGPWSRGTNERIWVGMRPLTPDGLPVIGRVPATENLYVNGGHQMLGITLAPASGEAIAMMMCGEPTSIDMTPFDPARFIRR
jgi:D-amino-acid dehydrogenase